MPSLVQVGTVLSDDLGAANVNTVIAGSAGVRQYLLFQIYAKSPLALRFKGAVTISWSLYLDVSN